MSTTEDSAGDWMEIARKITVKLPPDILEHPMPFPHRLDYAAKIIAQELAVLFRKHAPAVAKSATSDDKPISAEWMLEWHCEDCKQSGSGKFAVPCGIRDLTQCAWEQHHEYERKHHCVCPGHYLKITRICNFAPQATDEALRAADELALEVEDQIKCIDAGVGASAIMLGKRLKAYDDARAGSTQPKQEVTARELLDYAGINWTYKAYADIIEHYITEIRRQRGEES